MIIFDKIKKALFTEVDDDEEYSDVVEDENRDYVEMEKSVVYEKKKPKPKTEPVQTRRQSIPVVVDEEEPIKSSVNIRVDEPKVEKQERKLKPLERKEFEIPQVISPIHGSKEDEDETVLNQFVPTPKTKEKKNVLGTIVSPFYGDVELEEFEAKAQVDISNEKLKQEDTIFSDDDEIENVSLDQIVSTNVEDEDEMIQFSLFGDNKAVKSFAQEEINTSLDDLEANDNTDEDLPF